MSYKILRLTSEFSEKFQRVSSKSKKIQFTGGYSFRGINNVLKSGKFSYKKGIFYKYLQ